LEQRIRDRSLGDSESERIRDALLAFISDSAAQTLIADLLRDTSLGERAKIFVLDTVDTSRLKELPAAWVESLSGLHDSPSGNVRLRVLDLIRSRAIGGLDRQPTKIAPDAPPPEQDPTPPPPALPPPLPPPPPPS